tara:strand:- start:300 stop:2459 length:2160 start_codon:yes stop_codon:yes gene_type:complete
MIINFLYKIFYKKRAYVYLIKSLLKLAIVFLAMSHPVNSANVTSYPGLLLGRVSPVYTVGYIQEYLERDGYKCKRLSDEFSLSTFQVESMVRCRRDFDSAFIFIGASSKSDEALPKYIQLNCAALDHQYCTNDEIIDRKEAYEKITASIHSLAPKLYAKQLFDSSNLVWCGEYRDTDSICIMNEGIRLYQPADFGDESVYENCCNPFSTKLSLTNHYDDIFKEVFNSINNKEQRTLILKYFQNNKIDKSEVHESWHELLDDFYQTKPDGNWGNAGNEVVGRGMIKYLVDKGEKELNLHTLEAAFRDIIIGGPDLKMSISSSSINKLQFDLPSDQTIINNSQKILNVQSLTKDEIKKIQQIFTNNGINVGVVDGIAGRKLKTALYNFFDGNYGVYWGNDSVDIGIHLLHDFYKFFGIELFKEALNSINQKIGDLQYTSALACPRHLTSWSDNQKLQAECGQAERIALVTPKFDFCDQMNYPPVLNLPLGTQAYAGLFQTMCSLEKLDASYTVIFTNNETEHWYTTPIWNLDTQVDWKILNGKTFNEKLNPHIIIHKVKINGLWHQGYVNFDNTVNKYLNKDKSAQIKASIGYLKFRNDLGYNDTIVTRNGLSQLTVRAKKIALRTSKNFNNFKSDKKYNEVLRKHNSKIYEESQNLYLLQDGISENGMRHKTNNGIKCSKCFDKNDKSPVYSHSFKPLQLKDYLNVHSFFDTTLYNHDNN